MRAFTALLFLIVLTASVQYSSASVYDQPAQPINPVYTTQHLQQVQPSASSAYYPANQAAKHPSPPAAHISLAQTYSHYPSPTIQAAAQYPAQTAVQYPSQTVQTVLPYYSATVAPTTTYTDTVTPTTAPLETLARGTDVETEESAAAASNATRLRRQCCGNCGGCNTIYATPINNCGCSNNNNLCCLSSNNCGCNNNNNNCCSNNNNCCYSSNNCGCNNINNCCSNNNNNCCYTSNNNNNCCCNTNNNNNCCCNTSNNCCPSTTTTTCACNNNGGCGGCPCQNTFNPYWLPLGSPPCATTSTNNCCCNSNCNTGCNTGCFSSCNTGCNNGCSFYGRRKRHAMKRLAARAQSAAPSPFLPPGHPLRNPQSAECKALCVEQAAACAEQQAATGARHAKSIPSPKFSAAIAAASSAAAASAKALTSMRQ